MYIAVPTVVCDLVMVAPTVSFARPKPRIFATPSVVTINVGRFDVAVDDSGGMRFGQPAGDLFDDGDRLADAHRPALHHLRQRFAVIAGHGQKHLAVIGLAEFVNGADVRVIELRGGPRLRSKRFFASGSRVSVSSGERNFSATVGPSFRSSAR
ncbi:MAG: hypothetical protein AABO58_14955 [Acidobacteriota bacterium]